jgi:hypothetical protein
MKLNLKLWGCLWPSEAQKCLELVWIVLQDSSELVEKFAVRVKIQGHIMMSNIGIFHYFLTFC